MENDNTISDIDSSHPSRVPRRIILWLGAYAFFGGLISILGWAADIPRLADWNGNGISIQPNASVAALTAALAVLTVHAKFYRIAAFLGILVFLIGAATLFQIVTDIDLGINDVLMFGREWGRVGVTVPGRMGTPASTSWTLIGIAILITAIIRREQYAEHLRRSYLTAAVFGLITLIISTLSITGYFYGAEALYTRPQLTVIAFQTATFIFAISLALVLSIPEAGPMRVLSENNAAGAMTRSIVPVIVLIPIVLGFLRLAGERLAFYGPAFGTALRTILEISLLLLLLWVTALSVSNQEKKAASRAAALKESERRRKLA